MLFNADHKDLNSDTNVCNMMASLPANDPARRLSVTSRASVRALINDATRRNLFTGHKETKNKSLVPVPQADLVFGGSYPIDEPLSARNVSPKQKPGHLESVTHKNNGGSYPIDEPLSARNVPPKQKAGRLESVTRKINAERTPTEERRTTGQITITRPKTFQIDGICCVPPNLCEDHAAAALVSAHQEEVLAEGSANTMLPLHDDKFVKQYLAAYYGAKEIEGDEEDYYYHQEEDGEMYDEDDYEDYQPSDVDYEAEVGNYPSSAEQQSHGGENTTSITAENEQKSEECRRRKAVTYQEMPSNHDTSPPEAKLNYAKDSKDPPPAKCLDDLIKDYKEKSAIASNVSLTIPPPDLGQLQEFLRPPAHLQQV